MTARMTILGFGVLVCAYAEASESGGAACKSALDCGLGGECSNGACYCWPTFAGPNCTTLNLLPAPKKTPTGAPGYQILMRDTWTSWGGSVVQDRSKTWHLLYSNMANNCGLDSWEHNSESRHFASQGGIVGPYGPAPSFGSNPSNATGSLASPLFSHNTRIRTNPVAAVGAMDAYLLYHTGLAQGPRHPPLCKCIDGSTGSSSCGPPESRPLPYEIAAAAASNLQRHRVLQPGDSLGKAIVSSAPNPAGPWTPLPGQHEGFAFNNPAPVLLDNGTVLMYYKAMVDGVRTMALARAPQWNASFEFVGNTGVVGEDPFVWVQNGTYHMIFHTCCDVKIMSMAWSEDGLKWHVTPGAGHNVNPYPAFSKTIELQGGGNVTLSRRERHFLVIDPVTGIPTHLMNGAEPSNDDEIRDQNISPEGVVTRGGIGAREGSDWTYTSVQPLAVE